MRPQVLMLRVGFVMRFMNQRVSVAPLTLTCWL